MICLCLPPVTRQEKYLSSFSLRGWGQVTQDANWWDRSSDFKEAKLQLRGREDSKGRKNEPQNTPGHNRDPNPKGLFTNGYGTNLYSSEKEEEKGLGVGTHWPEQCYMIISRSSRHWEMPLRRLSQHGEGNQKGLREPTCSSCSPFDGYPINHMTNDIMHMLTSQPKENSGNRRLSKCRKVWVY